MRENKRKDIKDGKKASEIYSASKNCSYVLHIYLILMITYELVQNKTYIWAC